MAKPTGTDFRPAKPWEWLITLGGFLNQVLLSRHITLDVRPADLELLRGLPLGCLIAPNHAHYSDSQVTFELVRRAGRRVIYMATREVFDAWRGLGGWFLQRLGVFSVNRGGTNVEGRRFAQEILTEGAHDLLMFPEGEIYLLNDLVMPLKPGVARLAIEAARELAQHGQTRRMLIVPVAIKYQCVENIGPLLEATTARLESHVFDDPRTGPLYPRIVALGTELLSRAELRYGLQPNPGDDIYERVRQLRRSLLDRLELKYFGRVHQGFDFDRARKLMIRLQGLLLAAPTGEGYYGSPAASPDDPLAADLEAARLCARSVAFHEDYLIENPTQERIAETLTKLEREVLGKETRTPLGRRRAVVRIARPLDVLNFVPAPDNPPSLEDSIEAVVIRLHETLQATLDAMGGEEKNEA